MNTGEVIESYVRDVMRRLPRRDRDDIGFELRDLLIQMLHDRAQAAGRPGDEAMALAMLTEFGAPEDIAARYRPEGFVIIPPEQARVFAWTALLGVGLQWALTLPALLMRPDGLGRLGSWWLSWGLGAFWWPGFMVTMLLIGAGLRGLRTTKAPVWRPKTVDPDRINRAALAAALVWFALGSALLIGLAVAGDRLPGPLGPILAFDPDFVRSRAIYTLPLWAGSFAVLIAVLIQGRWRTTTRRFELALNLAFVALLSWYISAPAIFARPATDEGAKGCLVLLVAAILLDSGLKLHRRRVRFRTPAATAG